MIHNNKNARIIRRSTTRQPCSRRVLLLAGSFLVLSSSFLPIAQAFLSTRLLPTATATKYSCNPPNTNNKSPINGPITNKNPFQLKDTQDASSSSQPPATTTTVQSFDDVVMSRTACKKFQRHDGNYTRSSPILPSPSNPSVVEKAWNSLKVAQRAPSSFNTQPYKVVLVHSQEHKRALSHFCLGPNGKRVLDSDCTAIFLADREVMRSLPKFLKFQMDSLPADKPQPNRFSKFLLCFYVSLFSSGYPLPRILAAPISFVVRAVFSVVEALTRWFYVLPSLSNAESWATKQVLPVAMVYMLACTSRGLATCPMEGINAAGIRRALKIPRRYTIPLIVTTGLQYKSDEEKEAANVAKTASSLAPSPVDRYPMEEMIFSNQFGVSGA